MSRKCRLYIFWLVMFLFLNPVRIVQGQAKPSVDFSVTRVGWGGDPDSPIKAYPGDTGVSLTVEAQNLSPNETIKGVRAVLILDAEFFTDIYGNGNATATGEPRIGEILNPTDHILPKGFFTLTFSLDINANTVPARYLSSMIVEYSVNCSGIFLDGEPQSLFVQFLASKTESAITCAVSPEIVETSDSVDVSGSLTPLLENVTVKLIYIGPDGSALERTMLTDVEGAFQSSYQPEIAGLWRVNASWSGDERHIGSQSLASFEARSPVSLSVFTSSNRLVGGLDNAFNVTLLNSGDVALLSIDLTFNIPSPLIVHGNNHVDFSRLEPGSSASVVYEIFAPEGSIGTTFSGALGLEYDDDYGESHSDSQPAGLIVTGRIELVAFGVVISPQPVRIGSKVSITATLLNKGNVAANYVNATIVPNTVLGLTAESSAYVGEVEENSPVPFTLTANVKPDAGNGTFPVAIGISYRDDQYGDQSFNTTVHLLLEQAGEGENDSSGAGSVLDPLQQFGLVLLILFAASLIIGFLYWRSATRKKGTRP